MINKDEAVLGMETYNLNLSNEDTRQEALLNSWENIYSRGARGENIAEWDLARRISAVTEGDTREGRVQDAIKDYKRSEIVDAKLRERLDRGQSEEDFYKEQDKFGTYYRNAVKQANREIR